MSQLLTEETGRAILAQLKRIADALEPTTIECHICSVAVTEDDVHRRVEESLIRLQRLGVNSVIAAL